MGGKSLRKFEVCDVRRVRKLTSDTFLARFPLNPNRCRMWVKAGNEDLAYLPIQRLHENKFICEDHFSRKMFKKKGADPSLDCGPSTSKSKPKNLEDAPDLFDCGPSTSNAIDRFKQNGHLFHDKHVPTSKTLYNNDGGNQFLMVDM